MKGVKELDELLAELASFADTAIEHDRIAEDARQAIRDRLPKARKLGAGPALLERTVKSLYVEKTISRWTADDTPDASKPRPKRKRPGAAPNGS
jgi:hypothetical protein